MFQNSQNHSYSKETQRKLASRFNGGHSHNQGEVRPGTNKNILFRFNGVSVDYGNLRALDNIHLIIEKSEVVFITGRSGAGKTTLLKVISGVVEPNEGSVEKNLQWGSRPLFLSQVFQDLRLINKKTIYQNLMLVFDPKIFGTKDKFLDDLHELARLLGIQDRLHLKVSDANGGLVQKTAIIRALLGRPDIFIADEPSSSLDLENAQKIFDLLSLYNIKRGMTVIWASHNRDLVARFSGRIVHLDGGRIIHSGHACFI
jgi:ABC-type multidrug transport system ATPase subunit